MPTYFFFVAVIDGPFCLKMWCHVSLVTIERSEIRPMGSHNTPDIVVRDR